MQQLEQISRSYQGAPAQVQENHQYGRLELYTLGVSRLYSGISGGFGFGPAPLGFDALGGGSIFDRMDSFAASRPLPMASSPLPMARSQLPEVANDNYFKQYKLPDFTLQERVDAKDPNDIHLNYDVFGRKAKISTKLFGEFHKIKLFDEDKD